MFAVKVPAAPLYALVALDVATVPEVYLLAVEVFKSAPATKGLLALLSVKPEASFGYDPAADVLSVMLLVLKLAGAEGTAFKLNVTVSVSV
jgi:hypothetical protein